MKSNILMGSSVLALAVFTLQADTLRLRDGRVITGTFQSATRNDISFRRDGGQTDRFEIGSVDTISFGNDGNFGTSGDDRRGRIDDQGRYNDQTRSNTPVSSDRTRTNDRYSTTNNRYPTTNDRYSTSSNDRYPTNSDRNSTQNDRYNATGVIPAGTVITVRMIDSVDSDSTHAGDTYHASIDQPVVVNGQTVAPAGSDATIQVVRVQQGGRITGREDVTLALASFQANGRTYDINTSNENVSSNSRGTQSAEVIGGGAALGAIIGAIAGGGKGAAIGAASGAALGTGAQVLRGQKVKVPSETRLSFTLTRDLTL